MTSPQAPTTPISPPIPTMAPRAATVAAVALAATGPLAIAVLRVVLPYDTVDDAATIATKVAANPGAQAAVLGLSYLALLTLPIGVALAGRLAMRSRPVLGTVAAAVAWIGFVSLFASIAFDSLALAGARAGVPVPTVSAMGAALDAEPLTSVPLAVFVPGHILGAVLLAVALWRVIPRWAAVALAISQPLHLVFAVVVTNHLLDGVAWLLTGAGLAAAALVGARRG
jgi:hypothetical protein